VASAHHFARGRNIMRSALHAVRRYAPQFADLAVATVRPSANRFLSVDPADLLRLFVAAMETWRPELIIFGDEATRRVLNSAMRQLEAGAIRWPADIVTVMRRSLGPRPHFETLVRKSALAQISHNVGLLTPTTRVIESVSEIADFAARHQYPVVLKPDFGSGATRVAICNNRYGVSAALKTFDQRPDVIKTAPRVDREFNWYEEAPRTIVQTFIDGRETMSNFVAMNGRVLASFESSPLERAWDHGPASVIRFTPNTAVAEQTERLAARGERR
jgi:hypothetical protein